MTDKASLKKTLPADVMAIVQNASPAFSVNLDHDTIYAPCGGGKGSAISSIRLSGPQTGMAIMRLTKSALPEPRAAKLCNFYDPSTDAIFDRGLLLWFPAPKSMNGEDMAELHLHGGQAVLKAALNAMESLGDKGFRLARPGEFVRRAFENGKLDLTQVEGLSDLLNAETEAQRIQAMRQLNGALGALYEDWRVRLMTLLSRLEAEIDFSDQDLGEGLNQHIKDHLINMKNDIDAHLQDGRRGERLRDGFVVALLGPPNSGKSSLLNRLLRREAAIVSDEAGTTRDIIETHLDIKGYPVALLDTAGLRSAASGIEAEGMRRALGRADEADLRLLVVSPDLGPAALEAAALIAEKSKKSSKNNELIIINKSDLFPAGGGEEAARHWLAKSGLAPDFCRGGVFAVSAKSGLGIEKLVEALGEHLAQQYFSGAREEQPALTRARHRASLYQVGQSLSRAITALDERQGAELIAEDLRLAARHLGAITGRTGIEDMLDLIFADFCIGK